MKVRLILVVFPVKLAGRKVRVRCSISGAEGSKHRFRITPHQRNNTLRHSAVREDYRLSGHRWGPS